MNTVESVVTKVLSEPYFKYLWCVDVEADCYGNVQKATVHCQTEHEAK